MATASLPDLKPSQQGAEPPDVSGVLPFRLWALFALLAVETIAIGKAGHPWLHAQQPAAGPLVFAAAVLFFGRIPIASARLDEHPVSFRYVGSHALAVVLFALLDFALLRHVSVGSASLALELTAWLVGILLLFGSLLLVAIPPQRLMPLVRRLGLACWYAAGCAVLAMSARTLGRMAWDAPGSRFGQLMVDLAFRSVENVLRLFYRGVMAQPATHLIGTPRFQVIVAGACSGIEGLALMLVLTVGWLIFARRELRLSRAVWLVPVCLALMWSLNVLRIATLIAIGDGGHAEIAENGFHSEAGWIAFTSVAIGFLVVANRVPALRRRALEARGNTGPSTPSLYLLPFMALLATSLLTRAASAGFELLYPLRVAVVLAVLILLRRSYRRLDWRFSWVGPCAGAVVGALWVLAEHGQDGAVLASGLAHLSSGQRLFWLSTRVLAAVIPVPIAEELAFRGFLARRMQAEEVNTVPYRTLGWMGIGISSLAFGAMHGRMWLAGTLAGVAFALCAKVRNRLGEAVAAHAVANLVLALCVLSRGDYGLW